MITKFKDVSMEINNNNINVFMEVEFLNQPETMVNPVVKLKFENGKFIGSDLLEEGGVSAYEIDEVEEFQAVHYLSKLPDSTLNKLMFGGKDDKVVCS